MSSDNYLILATDLNQTFFGSLSLQRIELRQYLTVDRQETLSISIGIKALDFL